MFIKMIAMLAGLACVAQAGSAMARSVYACGGGAAPLISVMLSQSEGRGHLERNGRNLQLRPESRGKWVHADRGPRVQFFTELYPHRIMGDKPPAILLGTEEFLCTLQRDGHGEAAEANRNGRVLNLPGQSLGGKLRSGPGLRFPKIASVPEHAPLTILRDTGITFDGYDWFEVRLTNGGMRGYQWGGIMCTRAPLKGIYRPCPSARATRPEQPSGHWMAFAVGDSGRFGHGAAPTRGQAEIYAMKYCGSPHCRIDNVTRRRCQALSQSEGGHWYGAAAAERAADDIAVGACTRATGKACAVTYSHCY